jgi:hypothetical protein
MAHAAVNRVLTVGLSPAPMAGVVEARVAVKVAVKDVADGADGDGASAPDQGNVTAWTPTASQPATTA